MNAIAKRLKVKLKNLAEWRSTVNNAALKWIDYLNLSIPGNAFEIKGTARGWKTSCRFTVMMPSRSWSSYKIEKDPRLKEINHRFETRESISLSTLWKDPLLDSLFPFRAIWKNTQGRNLVQSSVKTFLVSCSSACHYCYFAKSFRSCKSHDRKCLPKDPSHSRKYNSLNDKRLATVWLVRQIPPTVVRNFWKGGNSLEGSERFENT